MLSLNNFYITDGNEEGFFNVTRTEDNIGVIRVTGSIDREKAASHLLTIKCFKLAEDGKKLNYLRPYNRQDPSERQVLIHVEDVDDNSPRFDKNNVTIGKSLVFEDFSKTTKSITGITLVHWFQV